MFAKHVLKIGKCNEQVIHKLGYLFNSKQNNFFSFSNNLKHLNYNCKNIVRKKSALRFAVNQYCSVSITPKPLEDLEDEPKIIPWNNKSDSGRSMLRNLKNYNECFVNFEIPSDFTTKFNDLDGLLNQDWKSFNNDELLENFENVTCISNKNRASMVDEKYNEMAKALSLRIQEFSDEEIIKVLKLLSLWYSNPEIRHNISYKNLWSAIDYQCVKRCRSWEPSRQLYVIDLFLKARIIHCTQYPWHTYRRLNRRLNHLTLENLVLLGYYLKFCNYEPKVNFCNYESCLYKHVEELSIQEISVISFSFRKHRILLKNNDFIKKILRKIIDNLDSIQCYEIKTILYILRNRQDPELQQALKELLSKLVNHVDKYDTNTMVKLIEFQSCIIMENEELMSKIISRLEGEVGNLSLKSIYTALNGLWKLNYKPENCQLLSVIAEELKQPLRQQKIIEKRIILAEILVQMARCSYYAEDLLKQAMDPEFIRKACYNNNYLLNYEYLFLNYYLELEQPNYNGPKLEEDILNLLTKRFGCRCNYYVNQNSKFYQSPVFRKQIDDILQKISGAEIYSDCPLPHLTSKYSIVCLDKDNNFVSPKKLLEIPLGKLKYAPKDGNKWIPVIIGHHANFTRDTLKIVGTLDIQLRHLKICGYQPIVVPFFEWEKLSSQEEQTNYLKNLLYQ